MKPKRIEDIYQSMTPIEHILKRPDSYIGSTQRQSDTMWVWDDASERMQFRQIEYVPGLYKIFDEILVNAADNYQRDHSMNTLKVSIEPENRKISVWNNGKSIPIEIHKDTQLYVPDMIFGVLLTGSNYDDTEKRVVGGRNGYGAKLTNIYSKKFVLEVQDAESGKYYTQTWTNNMSNKTVPDIKTAGRKDNHVQITFYPDLAKFSMERLDEDIVALMKKRVYDLAGIFGANVKVILNGQPIKINSFAKYIDLYFAPSANVIKVYDKQMNTPRWEVLVTYSPTQFQQVSFVNSISTSKGGTHVNYVTDKIVSEIQSELTNNKKYKGIDIQKYQIKSCLWVFINCLVDNPVFDSQTKENMTTKVSEFGGASDEKFHVTELFSKNLLKTDILDAIVTQAKAKQNAKINRQLKGTKSARLFGIEKLDDANDAGKRNSEQCTLILTEGDSAKTLVMAAIDIIGRDRYGVYPLRGKLLNVRDASGQQILNNEEIQNIIKIVGLQKDKQYTDLKSLRYGSIMFMADQDTDGSHIKGLLMNFIHHFWPSLIQIRGFLTEFVTPIIKVSKGRNQIQFFTVQDFKRWCDAQGPAEIKSWNIKYYKGLGTSDDDEAKDYFSNLQKHRLFFRYIDDNDDKSIDLCFNKKKANERKQWLEHYDPDLFVNHNEKNIRYQDFVDRELIHFSMYDNIRSIPSVVDGAKPGQRKVLFCCFKRNLREELKVVQLGGYVAEHSAYHHGEQSLAETIIGMAQNFPGTNNINLLMPKGQFGSRLGGGKDHASARYIHTNLNKITRLIFPEADDHSLEYKEDDGHIVEPSFYIPIIPMVLVNGAEGIGTGWSTFVPNYNPRDVIEQIKRKLNGKDMEMIHPWYRGWDGEITQNSKGGYNVRGIWEVDDANEQLNIMELPLKKWTKDYKEMLEKMIQDESDQNVVDYREYHTKHRIHFQLQMNEGLIRNINIEKHFKLASTISTLNLVLFNPQGKLRKYANVIEIMEEYFALRVHLYDKRKDYLASKLEREIQILDNKVRFILAVIHEDLRLKNVKKLEVCKQMLAMKFAKQSELIKIRSTKLVVFGEKKKAAKDESGSDEQEQESQSEPSTPGFDITEYNYLLTMSLMTLTYEKVEKLKQECSRKKQELKGLLATEIQQMWMEDLAKLEAQLTLMEADDEKMLSRDPVSKKGKPMKKPKQNKMIEEPVDDSQKKPTKAQKNLKQEIKQEQKQQGNKDGQPKKPRKPKDENEEKAPRRRKPLKSEASSDDLNAEIKSLTDQQPQPPLRPRRAQQNAIKDENSFTDEEPRPRFVKQRIVDSDSSDFAPKGIDSGSD